MCGVSRQQLSLLLKRGSSSHFESAKPDDDQQWETYGGLNGCNSPAIFPFVFLFSKHLKLDLKVSLMAKGSV